MEKGGYRKERKRSNYVQTTNLPTSQVPRSWFGEAFDISLRQIPCQSSRMPLNDWRCSRVPSIVLAPTVKDEVTSCLMQGRSSISFVWSVFFSGNAGLATWLPERNNRRHQLTLYQSFQRVDQTWWPVAHTGSWDGKLGTMGGKRCLTPSG